MENSTADFQENSCSLLLQNSSEKLDKNRRRIKENRRDGLQENRMQENWKTMENRGGPRLDEKKIAQDSIPKKQKR